MRDPLGRIVDRVSVVYLGVFLRKFPISSMRGTITCTLVTSKSKETIPHYPPTVRPTVPFIPISIVISIQIVILSVIDIPRCIIVKLPLESLRSVVSL